jgi:hypothetical protein
MMALVLALGLADPTATVTDIRVEGEGQGWAVRVVAPGLTGAATVHREGNDVVVVVPAALAAPVPAAKSPTSEIKGVTVEGGPAETRVRIRLLRALPYEVRQDQDLVSVVFNPHAREARAALELRDLYAKILPPAPGDGVPGGPAPQADGAAAATGTGTEDLGFHMGFVRFRPSLVVSYIDAQTALLDTPVPVRDKYFQIEPHLGFGLGAQVALPGGAGLRVAYEPRFRAYTSFEALRRPSHLATATLTVPVGPSVTLRGIHHFARGLLETTEVDPGREYFFNLVPFTRRTTTASAAFEPGGPLGLTVTAGRDTATFDGSGFFDHRTDTLLSDLKYEVREGLNAHLQFGVDRVPVPAARPVAESRGRTLYAAVYGEILPLLSGGLSVGLRQLDAPRADAGGQRFRGAVGSARLTKEFTPTLLLALSATRGTYPSNFAGNAFYLASQVGAELNAGLPLQVQTRVGLGWQTNAYRVPVAEIGAPRRDHLLGWSAGIGRSLTRWAFLRADYRRERRTSNLSAFNSHSNVLVVSFGVGFVGAQPLAGS